MEHVIIRRVWRGLVLGFLALALILGALAGAGRAHADAVYTDLDPEDQVSEFVAAVTSVANEFPEIQPVLVDSDWIWPSNVYARSTIPMASVPGRITLNKSVSTNPDILEEHFVYDVGMGYHNPGCSPQTYVGLHEAAHQIEYAHGKRARLLVEAIAGDGRGLHRQLSGYSFEGLTGALVPGEALAEAFAAIKCEPETATQAEHELYNILISTK